VPTDLSRSDGQSAEELLCVYEMDGRQAEEGAGNIGRFMSVCET
jgi:hypothetical protein